MTILPEELTAEGAENAETNFPEFLGALGG